MANSNVRETVKVGEQMDLCTLRLLAADVVSLEGC